jgi:hypothetical protein
VLSDRSLWLRLDLRRASGLARAATHEMLLAAVARSGGQLQALDLSALDTRMDALMALLHANAGTLIEISTFLTELDAAYHTRLPEIHALLRAAPLLQMARMDVMCGSCAQARPLLRREGLFRPLRVHQLEVDATFDADPGDAVDEADTLALAADVAEHDTLTQLSLNMVQLERGGGALDALVTAALSRGLSGVHLSSCGLTAASVPALARLLGGGALRTLTVIGPDEPLLDAPPAAALLSTALRANTALETLTLAEICLWDDAAAATAVLAALTGHPSVRMLDVSFNGHIDAAVAAALGALVAANAPALAELDVSGDDVAQEGLAPLLDALLRNTHLRVLACEYNRAGATAAFVRQRLLPAVRANSSLRTLKACPDDEAAQSEALALLRQAEALVAARNAAR